MRPGSALSPATSGTPSAVASAAGAVVLRTRKSPAFWYSALGLVLLGLSFAIPLATARRTARAEERGGELAELLLREAILAAPLPLDAPWVQEFLSARLVAAAAAHGVFVADLERVEVTIAAAAVTLRNKHYVLQLRPTAPPLAPATAQPPELEVLAWPLHTTSPGHAVFFYPGDAEPAFSRNLQSDYFGDQPHRWPPPGVAHRRPDARAPYDYRGLDDERWILFDRPVVRDQRPGPS